MKKILILLLSIFALSCSKSDQDSAENEKSVDDITINTEKVSTPIAPKQAYSGFTDRSWFQLIGNDILYTCASNLGAANPQFMLKYNLNSNTFSTVTPDPVVCACGYMNSFVSDNTNAFFISNSAKKYTVATNTWSAINFPDAVSDNIGGSGMVYANGKIYACGGNAATNSFLSYNILSNTWSNENDYSENITISEMVSLQNKIYLLGGNATNNNFSYFDLKANTWVAKTNLNFEFSPNDSTNTVTKAKERYIFVLNGNKIHVYDTVKEQWKTQPITVSVSGSALHLFGLDDTTLLITGVSSSGDFALYKLTLNLP